MNKLIAAFVRKAVPRKVLTTIIGKQNATLNELVNRVNETTKALEAQRYACDMLTRRLHAAQQENKTLAEALTRARVVMTPIQPGPQRRH